MALAEQEVKLEADREHYRLCSYRAQLKELQIKYRVLQDKIQAKDAQIDSKEVIHRLRREQDSLRLELERAEDLNRELVAGIN